MTPEDHEQRQKRMGATDVSAVLGINPRRTAWEVAMEKQGRLEPFAGNDATDAGTIVEPAVLDYAERDLGPLERGKVHWAEGVGFPLASTLDGQVIASGVPVEAKTSGLVGPVYGHWGPPDSDEVPDVYLVQASIQMLCTGQQMAYLYALLGGRGFVRYQIHRDDSILGQVVDACGDWWERHVVQGVEPERTEPVPLDVVKRLRREPGSVTTFDDETTTLVRSWEDAHRRKLAAAASGDKLEAEILMRLGECEAGMMTDGRMFTYLEQTRAGYVTAETKFRVARIKKG